MVEGTVKFFNDTKNFGFIAGDDGKDYFVHRNDIKKGSLAEGDKVTFKPEQTDRGWKAVEVEKA
jgi:CspA family cold shock protein